MGVVARWIGWMAFAAAANAQQARVCVVNAAGQPLQGATVMVRTPAAQSGSPAAVDANACANVPVDSSVVVTMKDFAPVTVTGAVVSRTERVVMRPVATQETVTVTADRGLAGINDAASSVAVLTPEKLKAAPGLTLDDRLHQIAGFQLFRRTSSWTANPTSSGVSLRALGSTAASRTLVVSDQVPMNDAFGGWVHWTEIPEPAIRDVELVRGGSSELYGSSAIGGVIDVAPVEPREAKTFQFAADASGATENTVLADGMVEATTRWIAALAAASELKTDGYITTAPALRGSVDVPTNVNAQGGHYGTALQAALCEGHVHIVWLLLEHGAESSTNGLKAVLSSARQRIVRLLRANSGK